MRRIFGFIFLLIITLSVCVSAQTKPNNKEHQLTQTKPIPTINIPNPFRPIKKWVKRLLRINPKEIVCYTANVTNLTLSRTEIQTNLIINSQDNKRWLISVSTKAFDPEHDPLLYFYAVSAGKIIGEGERVVWDLTDVKPGTYMITAGVDDGCGVCGESKSKTVQILEPQNKPVSIKENKKQ